MKSFKQMLRCVADIDRAFIPYIFASGIFGALLSFYLLYASRFIVDMYLAKSLQADQLLPIVLLLVLGIFICSICSFFFKYLVKERVKTYRTQAHLKLLHCTASLPLSYIENPDVTALLSSMDAYEASGSFGFETIAAMLQKFIEAFCLVIAASIQFIFLFSQVIIASKSFWSILDVAGFIILLALAALGILKGQSLLMKRFNQSAVEEVTILNAETNYYGSIAASASRIKELRHYFSNTYISRLRAVTSFAKNLVGQLIDGEIVRNVIFYLTQCILSVIAYVYLISKALSGVISAGDVTVCIGALLLCLTTISAISQSASVLMVNRKYVNQYAEYLSLGTADKKDTVADEKTALHNNVHRHQSASEQNVFTDILPEAPDAEHIAVKQVSFGYRGAKDQQLVLHNISLNLAYGKKIALVGENGSGKTTLVKLICGLYEPSSGTIEHVDADASATRPSTLDDLAVVFQDFFIPEMTVGQAVAASETYDAKCVEELLARVDLLDRIKKLPHGLESCLGTLFEDSYGDRPVELSGGERQKLAMARALYKDAPFLIFDEPTAALDPRAEERIYTSLAEISAGKGLLFISHRLASCMFCDAIAVLHDGHIVEYGTHQKLIEQDGLYKKLWDAQASLFSQIEANAE